MVLVMVATVCGRKQGKPSKILKTIQPLEETEVGIHSKNFIITIDDFKGWTWETKTVFPASLQIWTKKNFFSVKFLRKVGNNFFFEDFFLKMFWNIFWEFWNQKFWIWDSPGVLSYWICTSIRISDRVFNGLLSKTSYMFLSHWSSKKSHFLG